MNKLIKKGIPFTNSKLIAELACIKHHAIQQLIDNYDDVLEIRIKKSTSEIIIKKTEDLLYYE